MISERHTYKNKGIHISSFLCDLQQSFPGAVEKTSLQEKILTGIACDTKLRKSHNLHMFFLHLMDQSDNLISIGIAVCNCDIRCCGCCFDITVFHFLPLLLCAPADPSVSTLASLIYIYAGFLSVLPL